MGMAALTMGAVLWVSQDCLMSYTHGTWFVRFLALAALVGSGILVYGVATLALGAFTRDDLALLRRRKSKA